MVFLQTPLVTDTRIHSPKLLKTEALNGLLQNTIAGYQPVQIFGGILTDTKIGSHFGKSHVPVIRSKTHAKQLGMVPYPGKHY